MIQNIQGIQTHFRPETSDENVLKEVIKGRTYRRATINFDVNEGESWLDLGANIGAFAVYCRIKKARHVRCYEPDPECFRLLQLNAPNFLCFNTAITHLKQDNLQFWTTRKTTNYTRYTSFPSTTLPQHIMLPNQHGEFLKGMEFDGVKMDIEGSEGGLIDNWLIPRCKKLCVEYHLSRDKSVKNLERRLSILKEHFQTVRYPPEFDRIIREGKDVKTFFDRLIFCKQ